MTASSNRPDIELALDVRSYEHVFVFVNPDAPHGYPDSWTEVGSREEVLSIAPTSVVIIDRIDASHRMLEAIGMQSPRLLALVPRNVEQEKLMRRVLSSVYPWSELWTLSTSFGKVLVTNGAAGAAYDRDLVRDERSSAEA